MKEERSWNKYEKKMSQGFMSEEERKERQNTRKIMIRIRLEIYLDSPREGERRVKTLPRSK